MVDNDVLAAFKPISLEEMGKVKLMNRIDTKYVTSFDKVRELLQVASGSYMVQEIEGGRNMPYYTKYFDTPDVEMFYQHQRGKKNRQKIRMRIYEGSSTLPFIEIKTKSNKGRTHKDRLSMTEGNELLPYFNFLSNYSHYDPSSLIPRVENHFYRITLVNEEMTERVTIDTGLEFRNLTTGNEVKLPGIGIIEWKRDGRNSRSYLGDILKNLRIHESGFSKYCIGMASTDETLRQNRLKPRLRMIERLNSNQ